MAHWADSIYPIREIDTRHIAVADVITPERYGEWTITELLDLSVLEPVRSDAFDVIHAYDRQSKIQLNTWPGTAITVTLEVLTRQACVRDADGNEIDQREINPTDKPLDGDIVEYQGQVRTPLGKQITSREIKMLRARGEREHKYYDYPVKNGRIKVPFLHALDMLFAHGLRLPTVSSRHVTFPPTRKEIEEAAFTKRLPRTREVINWWFREVFDKAEPVETKDARPRK